MMRLPYSLARWNVGDRPIEVTPKDCKYAMSINEEDGGPVIDTFEDYEYWWDFILPCKSVQMGVSLAYCLKY